MNNLKRLAIVLTVFLTSSAFAAPKLKFAKGDLLSAKVNGKKIVCGYKNSKWMAVVKSGKTYKQDSNKAAKSYCKKLLAKGSVSSLSQIPSTAELAKSSAKASGFKPSAVSGTPPTLGELATSDISSIFWSPGLVEAIANSTPTNEQCNQFYGGQSDGDAGGMAACYMTQGVGYAFENILQSGASLCYMKNAPSVDNLAQGGITLVGGEFPDNDVTKLFLPDANNNRIIKASVSDPDFGNQTIFIKVFSEKANSKDGNMYHTNLWFCQDGSPEPVSLEDIIVKSSGLLKASHIGMNPSGNGKDKSELTAYLKVNEGDLSFDSNRSREAEVHFVTGENKFKSHVELDSNNIIYHKVLETFDGSDRKGYSVSRFTGDTVFDMKFLEGAYKDEKEQGGNDFKIVTEFRDSGYVCAPESDLEKKLDKVNISKDTFYTKAAAVDLDLSAYSCSATADTEVAMDMANAGMLLVKQECETERLDGMDFCRSTLVEQANQRWQSVCMSEGGPQQ